MVDKRARGHGGSKGCPECEVERLDIAAEYCDTTGFPFLKPSMAFTSNIASCCVRSWQDNALVSSSIFLCGPDLDVSRMVQYGMDGTGVLCSNVPSVLQSCRKIEHEPFAVGQMVEILTPFIIVSPPSRQQAVTRSLSFSSSIHELSILLQCTLRGSVAAAETGV